MTDISPEPTADPTASLVRSVRRIAQAVDVRSREIARSTGLTLPQHLVLQAIRSLGEVSTNTICRDVSMSPPTVVAVLDRLEARALVERYRSTTDRRVVHARLTVAGQDALKDAPGLLGANALALWEQQPFESRQALADALSALATIITSPATLPPQTDGELEINQSDQIQSTQLGAKRSRQQVEPKADLS